MDQFKVIVAAKEILKRISADIPNLHNILPHLKVNGPRSKNYDRWLGYIQGVAVMTESLTLEECEEIQNDIECITLPSKLIDNSLDMDGSFMTLAIKTSMDIKAGKYKDSPLLEYNQGNDTDPLLIELSQAFHNDMFGKFGIEQSPLYLHTSKFYSLNWKVPDVYICGMTEDIVHFKMKYL